MANTFKNVRSILTDTLADVYTVPAATTVIVIGCHVTNVGATNGELTMAWTDSSNSDAVTYLAQAIVVPDAAAYEPVGKLVLEAGDKIRANANAASTLEMTVSVLEQS